MNSYDNDIDPKGIDPELNLSGWEYFWRKSELSEIRTIKF